MGDHVDRVAHTHRVPRVPAGHRRVLAHHHGLSGPRLTPSPAVPLCPFGPFDPAPRRDSPLDTGRPAPWTSDAPPDPVRRRFPCAAHSSPPQPPCSPPSRSSAAAAPAATP